jgi:hypothetical protein
MSSNSDPTAALLLGIGAGAFLFVKGFRTFREYRIVCDTPRMPIRSIAMGLVHVRGKAQSDKLLTSPVTRSSCCFYQVKMEEWESGKDGGWKQRGTDSDGARFYLQDESGKVLVNSDAAQFDLPCSPPRIVDSNQLRPAAGSGTSDQELLQYVQYARAHRFVNKAQQWLERKGTLADPRREQGRQALLQLLQAVPAPGHRDAPVHLGALQTFLQSGAALADPEKEQQRQMMIEHLREMDGQPLPIPLAMRTPEAASGRYRLQEYLILPGEEYNVTGTCVENPSASGTQDGNMIVKGQNEKTFVISWESEASTEKGLRKNGLGMIFGGAALLLVCLTVLLAHLGLL